MEVILPIVLLAAAFYLLILGPWRSRTRRAADLQAHLRPGVEIITTSGFIGRVRRIEGEEIHLELAPGVEVRLLFGAVGKILDPNDAAQAGNNAPSGTDESADEGGAGAGPASPKSH